MILKGLKGIAAYQTYLRVIFYLQLVRATGDYSKLTFNDAIAQFKALESEKKRQTLLELVAISPLNDRDILRLCGVHKDANGAAYSSVNIDNLEASQILSFSIETLEHCANIEIDVFF